MSKVERTIVTAFAPKILNQLFLSLIGSTIHLKGIASGGNRNRRFLHLTYIITRSNPYDVDTSKNKEAECASIHFYGNLTTGCSFFYLYK